MGMFDYVDIEYDLPMPENATEEQIPFIKQGIKANHFQTKDLECILFHYLIDAHGEIFVKDHLSLDKTGYKKEYIHQHVFCYIDIEMPLEEKYWWLEYDIRFTDGIIDRVNIYNWAMLDRPYGH